MKKLYAPWRTQYTKRVITDEKSDGCVFCKIRDTNDDAQELVLKRFEHCMVILNKYPYNAGHLLIVPFEHHKELYEYDTATHTELIEQMSKATEILQKTLGAHGCNVGINLGKAAGAGIPEHLHIHILPRFLGDTNFLPALTDTKQISIDLHEVYATLLSGYKNLSHN
jgi:ATP adenylyltransferase